MRVGTWVARVPTRKRLFEATTVGRIPRACGRAEPIPGCVFRVEFPGPEELAPEIALLTPDLPALDT